MRVVLKMNLKIGEKQHYKHDEFYLGGINWSDDGTQKYYIVDDNGKTYTVDSSLFDLVTR